MPAIVAEDRLRRGVRDVDRIIHVPDLGGPVEIGEPAEIMARTPIAPPVVDLGRVAGWSPLPLTVRNARRMSVSLRARLATVTPPPHQPPQLGDVRTEERRVGKERVRTVRSRGGPDHY